MQYGSCRIAGVVFAALACLGCSEVNERSADKIDERFEDLEAEARMREAAEHRAKDAKKGQPF